MVAALKSRPKSFWLKCTLGAVLALILCIVLVATRWGSRASAIHPPSYPQVYIGAYGARGDVPLQVYRTASNQRDLVLKSGNEQQSLGDIVALWRWSPDGSKLLVGKSLSHSIYPSGALYVYDASKHQFTKLTPFEAWGACWCDNSTVCCFEDRGGATPQIEYQITFLSLSGGQARSYPLPNGLIPQTALYTPSGYVYFTAVAPGRPQSWLYEFHNGHSTPIPGSYGSLIMTLQPGGSLLAVCRLDRGWRTVGIDAIDTNNPNAGWRTIVSREKLTNIFDVEDEQFTSDSRELVLTARVGDRNSTSIYVYDIASGACRKVAVGEQAELSSDGTKIYYVDNDLKNVYSCDLSGNDVQHVYSVLN